MFAKESRAMFTNLPDTKRGSRAAVLLVLLALMLTLPASLYAGKKKNKAEKAEPTGPMYDVARLDTSKLVWPEPPNIARIKWLNYYAGMKIDYTKAQKKKQKSTWMDRLAGSQQKDMQDIIKDFPFQLIGPTGIAVDSKGLVYVADPRVGAIFIFNTETRDVQLIRNGVEAKFGLINGLAMDDGDRLFVSDGKLRRVLVFNKEHKSDGIVNDGMVDPNGIALDKENRLLYVADTQQDQVLVYDADSFKLLRRIGTGGKNHWLTDAGNFAAPSGVAVDADGNVYVTDTLNNRVEIFDADGKFISQFGKHCDGPGCFARPKGIAIDCDGHIWVVDQMLDAVQIFNREGELMGFVGGHGNGPGTFAAAIGIAIDKDNRVFVTDQYPGRLQMFRYITDAEAAAEKKRREEEAGKKAGNSSEQSPAVAKETTQAQVQNAPQ
jgi:sugar lactone lactonase YvrE